jgi:hypothetical protein
MGKAAAGVRRWQSLLLPLFLFLGLPDRGEIQALQNVSETHSFDFKVDLFVQLFQGIGRHENAPRMDRVKEVRCFVKRQARNRNVDQRVRFQAQRYSNSDAGTITMTFAYFGIGAAGNATTALATTTLATAFTRAAIRHGGLLFGGRKGYDCRLSGMLKIGTQSG